MNDLKPLLEKLEQARFTGYLNLHLDRGQVISAELRHWLSNSEFESDPVMVEPCAKTCKCPGHCSGTEAVGSGGPTI